MGKNGRTGPTNLYERRRFVWLWLAGMSVRTIARVTGSSMTTVWRWVNRWRNEGNICSRYPTEVRLSENRLPHTLSTSYKAQPQLPATTMAMSGHLFRSEDSFHRY